MKVLQVKAPVQEKSVKPVNNGWDLSALGKSNALGEGATILDVLKYLKQIEIEIASFDKYVEYCVRKYRPFKYQLSQFLNDTLIGQAQYVENYEIQGGQFQGYLYWGQHLDVDTQFEPHGFGLLLDTENKIMQCGTFKNGKESGLQRTIQSFPLKERQLTQFTCNNGILHGPGFIERSSGRVEMGNYFNDVPHGEWKFRHLNGSTESKIYNKGIFVKP